MSAGIKRGELAELVERLSVASAGRGDERGDTRERLLSAGMTAFSSDGFRATTIRTLAARVGITPGAVYAHFSSKEEILVAAMARAWQQFLVAVVVPPDEGGETARLEGLCRRHMRFHMVTHPAETRATDVLMSNDEVVGQMKPEAVALLRSAHEAYFARLHREVARASQVDGGSPRVLTHAVITLLNSTCNEPHPETGVGSPEAIEREYLQLVLRMLGR
ncbi:TetR/AcrR family transcriptional regulator [Streptomyces sp. NPDC051322]|uniref:TetR/AcrR family transcriptional regulator n=1 Tax=Streptomyces sp. NPDC051322 TaxID=3154645 RepID=UPI00344C49C4